MTLANSSRLNQVVAKHSFAEESNLLPHEPLIHNQPALGGYADRHPQRANVPAINTTRLSHNNRVVNELQTPGTALDMNFTPLLPSQLLLGSPFQPGSPSNFASPQFQSFPHYSRQISNGAQQSQLNDPNLFQGPGLHEQSSISPRFQGMFVPPTGNNAQFYAVPQSPAGFANLNTHGFAGLSSGFPIAPGLSGATSRTVYLGNIPSDTSAEEILGHVRSGQIESIRLLPDKNCAFISFLDSSSATHFHSDAILKRLCIKGQDIKIGWGKPSQVPSSVAVAVQQSEIGRAHV